MLLQSDTNKKDVVWYYLNFKRACPLAVLSKVEDETKTIYRLLKGVPFSKASTIPIKRRNVLSQQKSIILKAYLNRLNCLKIHLRWICWDQLVFHLKPLKPMHQSLTKTLKQAMLIKTCINQGNWTATKPIEVRLCLEWVNSLSRINNSKTQLTRSNTKEIAVIKQGS
jgi:hypothetical protein